MSAIDYKKMFENEQIRYAQCKNENEQLHDKNSYLIGVLFENKEERCKLFQENQKLKNNIGEYTAIMLENAELKAENERLTQNELALLKTIDELEVKVREREEALRKCDPFTVYEDFDNDYKCFECNKYDEHTDNCLYVRLCGGVGNAL